MSDNTICTFCEDERDDLSTSGDVAICGDCMAIAEVDGETR